MAGSAWTNQVQNLVVVAGPTGTIAGVFVYSGSPGAGNPPIAWMSASTKDPFGNTIQPGIMLAETAATGNAEGGLIWNTATPGAAEPLLALYPNATVGFTGNSPFVLGRVFNRGAANEQLAMAFGGGGTAGSSPVQFEVFSQSKDGTILGHAAFYDWASTDLICDVNVNGIIAANPNSANTLETWHAMTPLLNSWTAAAGRVSPQYRKLASPSNEVEVIGSLVAPAGLSGASNIWALPSGYQLTDGPQPVVSRNATTNAVVMLSAASGAGDLSYQAGAAAGNTIDFHGFLSLDA